ncbi:MAG: hypothetical protein AAF636_08940 [Pseudomonadota bacterium]
MSSSAPQTVRRRQVFYIPGYDPFPPRRYRELYRREAAEQAALSGYQISFGDRDGAEGFGWRVTSFMDGSETVTDIDILVWSDIVRASRPASILRTYADLLRTAWIYLSTGALFRLMRLRKGPVIAALYPVVVLLLQLQLAVLVGWIVWRVGQGVLPVRWSVTALPLCLLAGFLVLRAFQRFDGRFFAYYLMHDYAFSARQWGAYDTAMVDRLEYFSRRIMAAQRSDVDEVLIVGHSSGAHLAISALSDVVRNRRVETPLPAGHTAAAPRLAALTLGQVVPMLTFLPRAARLRADLSDLSHAEEVTWIDVSAPGDGCCFALCDPVAVSGQAGRAGAPVVFSAAFSESLSAARWKSLRWRFFRLHFQYLCAFDRPRDYDYFQITAGPRSLAERYAGREASPGRIAAPMTAYPDVTL